MNILPRFDVFRLVRRPRREAFRLLPRGIKLGKLVFFFDPLQCCVISSYIQLIKGIRKCVEIVDHVRKPIFVLQAVVGLLGRALRRELL